MRQEFEESHGVLRSAVFTSSWWGGRYQVSSWSENITWILSRAAAKRTTGAVDDQAARVARFMAAVYTGCRLKS